jgi:hypothetical protein
MPRAIPVPIRETIVQRHEAGETLAAIATALRLSLWSVRKIWRRFRDLGAQRLAPDYDRCGPRQPHSPRRLYRAALWLRRRHPTWGAPVIRLLLKQRWPEAPVPHERTFQRWFRRAHLLPPPRQLPPQNPARGQEPHEVWQMDAKEKVPLEKGEKVSWLSLVDEASGGLVAGEVFPPGRVVAGGAPSGASSAAHRVRAERAAKADAGRQRRALGEAV